MKAVKKWLALCLAVCFCFTSFSIIDAAKKTITVKTQKQLEKALKEGKATKIILKTTKNVKITIPKSAKTAKITLQINAPNATINNKSTFKTIILKGKKVNFTEQARDNKITISSANANVSIADNASVEELKTTKTVKSSDIKVNGTVTTLTTRSDNASITVAEGAKVEEVRTAKKSAKVELVANGEVATVTVAGKETNIEISGNTESVKVVVTSKDNTVTTSIPVKTEIKGTASADLALKEGAEGSEIKADTSASITIDNKTQEEIKVTQGDKTITVGAGKKEEIKGEETQTTPAPTATPTPITGGGANSGSNNGDTTETLKPTTIIISGASTVAIPTISSPQAISNVSFMSGGGNGTETASSTSVTYTYTAIVKDQKGNEMKDQSVTWTIEKIENTKAIDITGVTMNNGTLTVTSEAEAGKIKITATLTEHKEVTKSKEIELTKSS